MAQKYAAHLARTGEFKHSDSQSRNGAGENLAANSSEIEEAEAGAFESRRSRPAKTLRAKKPSPQLLGRSRQNRPEPGTEEAAGSKTLQGRL
ncbi:hypothetical protein RRG08_006979 [Elysia crispata]|uniref:Uncharacterized protein n=1 Tax=Elysia crispata TaxID=231223 RepID=A0AAE0ZUE4_9GAST|nr:hypothetical protein RRG08_006979 [Elysia crispata]